MNVITLTAVITTLIICLGIVGKMDAESEAINERHYIKMVCEGSWPDYRNLEPECDPKQLVLNRVIKGR
jgi:hypothetical protein